MEMKMIDEATTIKREAFARSDRAQEMLQHMARVQIEATIGRTVANRVIDDMTRIYKAPGYVEARTRGLKAGVSGQAVAAAIGPMPDRCIDHVEQVVSLAYAPFGTRH